jgi:PBSX family phage portal protein
MAEGANGNGATAPPASETPKVAEERREPMISQARQRQIIKAIVVGPVLKEDLTTGATKELPEDDFLETLSSEGKIITPPFDPLVLALMPEHSTTLAQVIEAMEVNIAGFGYTLDSRIRADTPGLPENVRREMARERVRLTNFLAHCCFSDSLIAVKRRTRRDEETTGNGYWEVIRSPMTKEIDGFHHIPSYQIRLGVQDEEFTEIKRNRVELQEDGSYKIEQVDEKKRFRRYVQAKMGGLSRSFSQARGMRVRWFKEFGDPRVVNNETGEVVKSGDLPEEKQASELIHWRIYSPRTPYGLPRYVGNLITLFGDRAADEVNFITLRNNNVPSMFVLVSNGILTEPSIKRLEEAVATQINGSNNYSRMIILEAEGAYEGDGTGIAKVDVKPLTDQQRSDQMFQEYGKNNKTKIREAYRLPPIFVGVSEDYTRATAEASRRLADEQVFAPERTADDEVWNKLIFPAMGVLYHSYRSLGPNVTDDQDLIAAMAASERVGGMTPRIAREFLADIVGRDLGQIDPSKLDPDVPLVLQLAERVKNTGPMTAGQVTAMKAIDPRGAGGVLADLHDLRARLGAELDEAVDRYFDERKKG